MTQIFLTEPLKLHYEEFYLWGHFSSSVVEMKALRSGQAAAGGLTLSLAAIWWTKHGTAVQLKTATQKFHFRCFSVNGRTTFKCCSRFNLTSSSSSSSPQLHLNVYNTCRLCRCVKSDRWWWWWRWWFYLRSAADRLKLLRREPQFWSAPILFLKLSGWKRGNVFTSAFRSSGRTRTHGSSFLSLFTLIRIQVDFFYFCSCLPFLFLVETFP